MAKTKIVFENPNTGAVKEAPVGLSWTVLLFGFFPPMFRGDWKWGVIMLVVALITGGLSSLVFMFIYNKLYIKGLINEGYKAKAISSGDMDAVSAKIGMNIPLLEAAT